MTLEYGELNPLEQELINAAATGIWAGVPADGSPEQISGSAEALGADRTVRAEVLVDLLTRRTEGPGPRAMRLFRARITDD